MNYQDKRMQGSEFREQATRRTIMGKTSAFMGHRFPKEAYPEHTRRRGQVLKIIFLILTGVVMLTIHFYK